MSVEDTKESQLNIERERMHRSMISSVSHDLKTPLASIIGSLEIYERMRDKLSDEKKSALIRTALTESYRLDNFITNILDMAKLENGMVVMRYEQLSLEDMLRDIIIKFGPRIDKSHLTLPESYPALDTYTDTTLYARALAIILDNAVKHGGYPILISSHVSDDGKFFNLTIADSGAGIPKGNELSIFSKYTRFAKGDQQHAGTGLGLAICAEIMRILQGSVTIVPSAVGAHFNLSIPIRAA